MSMKCKLLDVFLVFVELLLLQENIAVIKIYYVKSFSAGESVNRGMFIFWSHLTTLKCGWFLNCWPLLETLLGLCSKLIIITTHNKTPSEKIYSMGQIIHIQKSVLNAVWL